MAKNQLLHVVKLLSLHLVLLVTLNASGSAICSNASGESACSNTTSYETTNEPSYTESYALRVFVSSSMPTPLLKSYAKEAKKYNATLVFKGLPNGSFKELSKLILSMRGGDTNDEELASIQIDDEAFEKFKVTSVPSVVLSNESEHQEAHTNSKPTYDKLDGTIYIKSALEKFASEGDTRDAAAKILKQAGSKTVSSEALK